MFRRFWRGEECRLAVFRGNRLWHRRLPFLLGIGHILMNNQAQMQEWKKEGIRVSLRRLLRLGIRECLYDQAASHSRYVTAHASLPSTLSVVLSITVGPVVLSSFCSSARNFSSDRDPQQGRMPRHSSLLRENLTMFLAQFRCSNL